MPGLFFNAIVTSTFVSPAEAVVLEITIVGSVISGSGSGSGVGSVVETPT